MNQLLEELFGVPTSTIVYGDNQGALFLVKNCQVSPQTKHIDICQHFVRELQWQKKVVGTKFVQRDNNMTDRAT